MNRVTFKEKRMKDEVLKGNKSVCQSKMLQTERKTKRIRVKIR